MVSIILPLGMHFLDILFTILWKAYRPYKHCLEELVLKKILARQIKGNYDLSHLLFNGGEGHGHNFHYFSIPYAYYAHIDTFFQMDIDWCHFRIVFAGEFIPMVKKTIYIIVIGHLMGDNKFFIYKSCYKRYLGHNLTTIGS